MIAEGNSTIAGSDKVVVIMGILSGAAIKDTVL
jgi:hypothetical protein